MLTRRALLTSAAALSATPALGQIPTADAKAQAILDRITEQRLKLSPEAATKFQRDKGELAFLRSQLTDQSAAGVVARAAMLRASMAELANVPTVALSPLMRTNVAVVQTAFGSALEGFAFGYGDVSVGSYRNSPYVVIQNVGAFIDAPLFLDNNHLVSSPADADSYLARMEAYASQLDGETEQLKADFGKGVVAPDFLIQKTVAALTLAQSGPPAQWQVVAALAKRTAAMPGDYAARGEAIAVNSIGPALQRQLAEMQRQLPSADNRAGAWKLPRGDAYYAWALSAGTTTKMSPDQVHTMGLEQLKMLQAQMEPILQGLGYSQGPVAARVAALGKDPRFAVPSTDAGREEILGIMRSRLAAIALRMPELFSEMVSPDVKVVRQAPAEEIGGAGAYGDAGTPDRSVPPMIRVNLRSTEGLARYTLPDLAYHEGIPGHGWQGQYVFKLPLIRSMLEFNAYSEGWALYAETLADEIGIYKDAPVERLGYLQSLSFRAARLVVDTGLHQKRWTREQAVAWFADHTGENRQGEVDRYCAWPGQACGYKVGHSHILTQREKARTALGTRFDLRTFNDAVVNGGAVPMGVLDGIIDRYVASRKT